MGVFGSKFCTFGRKFLHKKKIFSANFLAAQNLRREGSCPTLSPSPAAAPLVFVSDVTVVMVTAGARKPPRARRRVARCVSPYSTDSNYEPADPPRRRPPQRRRQQPRHQHPAPAAGDPVVTTPHAGVPSTGETRPSPAANAARPRPPPIAAKPRRTYNHSALCIFS